LKKRLTVSLPIEEVDCNLEEPAAAEALVNAMTAFIEAKKG